MDSERKAHVQSLERALDLLEALAPAGEASISELAARTGLVPSTVHRLLATLVARGYVTQPSRGRYRLGTRLGELAGGREDAAVRLRRIARRHLLAIQRETGETTNLVVPDGRHVVYLDQVEGSHSMRMFTVVGSVALAHTTGAGKAILAWLPEEELVALYGDGDAALERLTPRTLATRAELELDLERVRRRGFAVDSEEHEEGVSCVAAAVFDRDGRPCGAISVSGPSPRIAGASTADLGALVAEQARQISATLALDPLGTPDPTGSRTPTGSGTPTGSRPPTRSRTPTGSPTVPPG